MIIFHHNDLDGKCAAHLIYDKFKESVQDIKFIELIYGRTVDIPEITTDEFVYVVDYSASPEFIWQLRNKTTNVVFIDHHKTTLDNFDKYPKDLKGIISTSYCGAVLTYLYLNNETEALSNLNLNNIPKYLRYVDAADRRDFTTISSYESRAFMCAALTHDLSRTAKFWNYITDDAYFNFFISTGNIILKSDVCRCHNRCYNYGFECEFEGYKAFAVNDVIFRDYFETVDTAQYDILIGFVYNGKFWKYSLRSDTVDVEAIAKKYGGGGHKAAAGMELPEMILK